MFDPLNWAIFNIKVKKMSLKLWRKKFSKIKKNIPRTMVKTPNKIVIAKKPNKNPYGGPKVIFGQYFGHKLFIWNWCELGFSQFFLEYFSWFLRIFSDFSDELFFLTLYTKHRKIAKLPWRSLLSTRINNCQQGSKLV